MSLERVPTRETRAAHWGSNTQNAGMTLRGCPLLVHMDDLRALPTRQAPGALEIRNARRRRFWRSKDVVNQTAFRERPTRSQRTLEAPSLVPIHAARRHELPALASRLVRPSVELVEIQGLEAEVLPTLAADLIGVRWRHDERARDAADDEGER